jgi:hypothetical protein
MSLGQSVTYVAGPYLGLWHAKEEAPSLRMGLVTYVPGRTPANNS